MLTFNSPAETLKPPVLLKAPVRVNTPAPVFVIAELPEIVPERVTALVMVLKVLAASAEIVLDIVAAPVNFKAPPSKVKVPLPNCEDPGIDSVPPAIETPPLELFTPV